MTTSLKEPQIESKRARRWEVKRGRRNVGGAERSIRLAVGAGALAGLTTATQPWLQAVLGVVGAAGLLTGTSGYCPINRAAGRDSFHRHQ